MTDKKPAKPVVKLRHSSYQPSKAELNEDMRVDASPEDIARAVGRSGRSAPLQAQPTKGRNAALGIKALKWFRATAPSPLRHSRI